MLNGSKRGHCVRARAQPSSMSICARNRPPRSSMRPASRNPKSKTLNTNSVIMSDSGIHLAEKVVRLGKTTQIVESEVQLLSPFASSGRTADIMPLRARFRTVESKHVDHNMRASTCSMAQNVDILLAHALSHQECQSDVGFARLAPQRAISLRIAHFQTCANSTCAKADHVKKTALFVYQKDTDLYLRKTLSFHLQNRATLSI